MYFDFKLSLLQALHLRLDDLWPSAICYSLRGLCHLDLKPCPHAFHNWASNRWVVTDVGQSAVYAMFYLCFLQVDQQQMSCDRCWTERCVNRVLHVTSTSGSTPGELWQMLEGALCTPCFTCDFYKWTNNRWVVTDARQSAVYAVFYLWFLQVDQQQMSCDRCWTERCVHRVLPMIYDLYKWADTRWGVTDAGQSAVYSVFYLWFLQVDQEQVSCNRCWTERCVRYILPVISTSGPTAGELGQMLDCTLCF